MATSVVSYAVQELGKLLVNEANLLLGLRNEVQSMERKLRRMQCFLRDAELNQEPDARIKNWVGEIREVAYKVEDIVDTFNLYFGGKSKPGIGGWFLMRSRHAIAQKIQAVRKDIDEIVTSKDAYAMPGFGECSRDMSRSATIDMRRKMGAHFNSDGLVCFDKEEEYLCNELDDPSVKRLMVVSITGMAGSGKTTLAAKIFNDMSRRRIFSCWINISHKFELKDVLNKLNENLRKTPNETTISPEDIAYKLMDKGRYLIVLDDVWTTCVWDVVKSLFPDKNTGSRILITTRDENVARSAIPGFQACRLEPLDEAKRSDLFISRVLINNQNCSAAANMEDLVKLSEKTVESCYGSPLALVVVGDLLAGKDKQRIAWSRDLEEINWKQTEPGKQCTQVLALSYNLLPDHLKNCFRYFSLFPKSEKLSVKRLILLWIAEGFVIEEADETIEETAERYLYELIDKNLVGVVDLGYQGNAKTCKMHELFYDIAHSEARQADFAELCGKEKKAPVLPNVRRLTLHDDTENYMSQRNSIRKLRTLVLFGFDRQAPDIDVHLHSRRYMLLRILDLEGAPVSSLPCKIWEMVHLRYLGLRKTQVSKLPNFTNGGHVLQTLDLRDTFVRGLPRGVWRIKTLRHVRGYWRVKGESPKSGLRSPPIRRRQNHLVNLQTLSGVPFGNWIEKSGLAEQNNNLHTLKLIGTDACSPRASTWLPQPLLQLCEDASFFTLSRFPPNLTKVTLSRTRLNKSDWVLLEKLECLRILRLLDGEAYMSETLTCAAKGFQKLQVLHLFGLSVYQWTVKETAMPHLIHLKLEDFSNLTQPPSGLADLRSLQKLEINSMKPEFNTDAQRRLQRQGLELLVDRASVRIETSWLYRLRNFVTPWST